MPVLTVCTGLVIFALAGYTSASGSTGTGLVLGFVALFVVVDGLDKLAGIGENGNDRD